MAYKIFLDINILIDMLDDKRSNHTNAVKLIDMAEAGDCFAYVTESVLHTTAYLIRKTYTPAKFRQLFNHLLTFVELIPVTTLMYTSGLQRVINDVEDAILYTAALHASLDFYITNDIKDFRRLEIPTLPVMTAEDFLSNYAK
jgi:predicted nucleic acid-binding protein